MRPTFPSTLLRGHDLSVAAVRFAPGPTPGSLLTWGDDAQPRFWRIPDALADPVVLRAAVRPLVMGMAVSPDGRWVASSSLGDSKLVLWSIQDAGARPRELPVPGYARSIAFSADGPWLAAKSQDQGQISLWSLRDLTRAPVVLVEDDSSDDQTLRFSPDSRWLASGTKGDRRPPLLDLWDVSGEGPSLEPRHRCRPPSHVREIAFSSDAKLMATAAQDRTARVWNLAAANPCTGPIELPHGDAGNVVYQLTISSDARWAAGASMDGKGRLWDLKAGPQPKLMREVTFGDRVFRAVFSPDNRWVAFGSWDRTAALLDLRNAGSAAPIRLTGHVGRILAAGFSPDGRWLATAGEDRTLRLWDPAAPDAAPIVLRGHEAAVPHIGFTADGRWLVSAAYDGTVRQWRLRLEDLVQDACTTAGRQLLGSEIERYLGASAAVGSDRV